MSKIEKSYAISIKVENFKITDDGITISDSNILESIKTVLRDDNKINYCNYDNCLSFKIDISKLLEEINIKKEPLEENKELLLCDNNKLEEIVEKLKNNNLNKDDYSGLMIEALTKAITDRIRDRTRIKSFNKTGLKKKPIISFDVKDRNKSKSQKKGRGKIAATKARRRNKPE